MLQFEKLDVYRAALEFRSAVPTLVPKRGSRDLRDQIERAATSIVLNIAEGAGRRAAREKSRFYDIARGSAAECVAILAILHATTVTDDVSHQHARELLERIVMMLNRLISKFAVC